MLHLSRRAALAGAAALPFAASAQGAWPTRPVRTVVAFAAGGPADIVARLVAANLEKQLGQPFPVDNRAGAGGQIGTDFVAKAAPDGYTLLVTSSAAHGVAPGLTPNQPYDAVRDFTHIALVAGGPIGLMVKADAPWRTLADFIAAAKRGNAPVAYGSGGTGSLGHLTGELASRRMGIAMQHVPYRGSAPAQNDLVAGSIAAISDNLAAHAALIRAGTLRCLAVASTTRFPTFPEVPTYPEQGFPDLVAAAWFGVCGPAGLPAAVTERVNAAVRTMAADPEAQARIAQLGLRPEGQLSPAEYGAFVAREVSRWREVIQIAGVKPE